MVSILADYGDRLVVDVVDLTKNRQKKMVGKVEEEKEIDLWRKNLVEVQMTGNKDVVHGYFR